MTKAVFVGKVQIGGNAPVSVQSMTNTKTTNIPATMQQIEALQRAGADLVRVSVPDIPSVEAFRTLVRQSPVPLIADVHYSEKIALLAIEYGAAKLRVNPGNLPKKGLEAVAKSAKEHRVPIRVGVNAGSLGEHVGARELSDLALSAADLFERAGHDQLVLAVKCSDVRKTVEAYRMLHERTQYPLHIGLTEAGSRASGRLRSAMAIGALLVDGIGDTVRVSLAGDPVEEVYAAWEMLGALGLRPYPRVIACPTCARTQIDVEGLARQVEEGLRGVKRAVTVAVMGCAVNGIGEGKEADFGVCGGKEESLLFAHGKEIKRVKNEQILNELTQLLEGYHG